MKRFIAFILILALGVMFVSCGSTGDSAELLNAFKDLVPKASELYKIVYDDVLPHGEESQIEGYYRISEDSEYQSIAEIKSAIGEVFSNGYAKILYNTAFNGVAVAEGSINAKYMELDGHLYVNPEATSDFGKPREFDISSVRVVKQNRFKAIVAVNVAGSDEVLEVTMQKEKGQWKLDSAVY
ncbi:MAG: hypothetical protein HFE63_05455 [Clostridiales bacterium]|nr:hypothetical protein [Clostridiales bacterium]